MSNRPDIIIGKTRICPVVAQMFLETLKATKKIQKAYEFGKRL